MNPPIKWCPKCRQKRDVSFFSLRSNGYLRAYCKPCEVKAQNARERTPKGRAYKAAFDQKNSNVRPDRYRNTDLKRNYGITLDQWNQMFEEQGRRCAICRSSTIAPPRWWETDHCHKTNRVRGILCGKCNSILGFVDDNPATLINAAIYLLKQPKESE